MQEDRSSSSASQKLFTRRNLLLMTVGLLTIAAGYGVLVAGSASAAAVLLVLGYVVIFPLALVA